MLAIFTLIINDFSQKYSLSATISLFTACKRFILKSLVIIKGKNGSRARDMKHLVVLLALFLSACSSSEPTVGKKNVEQEVEVEVEQDVEQEDMTEDDEFTEEDLLEDELSELEEELSDDVYEEDTEIETESDYEYNNESEDELESDVTIETDPFEDDSVGGGYDRDADNDGSWDYNNGALTEI